ncbi:MAG: PEP-CTERM sorting domain-containing protein [Phycisphaerales bacterium]|nr:PEP-CTERM sorting domain-containing protein [Phycisphaerales bacterium]
MKPVLTAFACMASLALAPVAMGDVLNANPSANNGGSAGWGIFFDLTSNGSALDVTHMTTASSAPAFANFNIEIYVRDGSGLGNPGPGQSPTGWTSLGVTQATQGSTGSGISQLIDIPDIAVGAGQTVGVGIVFTVSGPRYFGTGSPPHQIFEDANLKLTTGDARSAPFTSGGSFFSSRGLVGSLTYEVIPAPGTLALMGIGGFLAVGRRRRD